LFFIFRQEESSLWSSSGHVPHQILHPSS